MSKRSFFLTVAIGLLASLTLASPSQAGPMYTVNVSETFSLEDTSDTNTISAVTFTFTNSEYAGNLLNTLTSVNYTGLAVSLGASPPVVTPVVSSNAAAGTITLTFSPSVFLVAGGVSFDTITTSNNVGTLQTQVKLASVTIVTPQGTDVLVTDPLHFTVLAVPEPSSMGLLGIGMAGFFAFRRFFDRRVSKV